MGVSQAGWEGAWVCVKSVCLCQREKGGRAGPQYCSLKSSVCLGAPAALGSCRRQPLWCAASSVSVHVVGTDPRRRKSPRGKLVEDFLQLSSPLGLPEEIVGRDGDRDHPLGAWWVRVPGRLTEGEKERMSPQTVYMREDQNQNGSLSRP